VFPDVPVSKKRSVRMGGQCGVEYWVVRVKPGRILFGARRRAVGLPRSVALAASKLPIKTRFVQRIPE